MDPDPSPFSEASPGFGIIVTETLQEPLAVATTPRHTQQELRQQEKVADGEKYVVDEPFHEESRAWMRFFVYFLETFHGHVRIDLGRGQAAMPQQLLDTAQVGAGIKHMRREGMAQRMR